MLCNLAHVGVSRHDWGYRPSGRGSPPGGSPFGAGLGRDWVTQAGRHRCDPSGPALRPVSLETRASPESTSPHIGDNRRPTRPPEKADRGPPHDDAERGGDPAQTLIHLPAIQIASNDQSWSRQRQRAGVHLTKPGRHGNNFLNGYSC